MKSVHFCPESMPLDKLLVDFLDRRQHLFIVIDEFKGLAGVVSLEDVLEEILGKEIVDESDEVVDMRELARRRKMAVGVK
jgi:CBS domain containing-hemolysin-like protein